MTRILFIGETWQGSSARSLREALARLPNVLMSDVGEDHFLPNYRHLPMRIANRLLHGFQVRELEGAVLFAMNAFRPDAIVVYKGSGIGAEVIEKMESSGSPVINVFPDYSPHAYGSRLQEAMGRYDLVISTKPFHPRLWQSVYGYGNPCVCVPHGYDPEVHYWAGPSPEQAYDVALCGNWRPAYHQLMRSFADALADDSVAVAIAGAGWTVHRDQLPRHWHYPGPTIGLAYGEFLRSARIAIAPVNREVMIHGVKQPGDEDTTRTYELAAAHCFFLHQRTDFVATVYDEKTEVPLWSDAAELASLVRRWLPDEAGRRTMAARAHARAVPAYSIPQRAVSVLQHIEQLIESRNVPGEAA
ncbi:MAG: glycosyltransferase [Proteobacteria bacterium]|nr:glycosyltransferase [Pseudomonadota bacterium]